MKLHRIFNLDLTRLFYLLPIMVFANLFLCWTTKSFLTWDSMRYIELAKTFPDINQVPWANQWSASIFPIGFPIILKALTFFTGDFLLSYRILSITSLLFVFIFVKYKNFFWREIWALMCFGNLLQLFPYAWTEVIFVPILILLFYCNYQFLSNKLTNNRFIIYNISLFFIAILIKYSSLFLVGGYLVFASILYLSRYNKHKIAMLSMLQNEASKYKIYLIVSIIAIIFFLSYTYFNYCYTGYFMGNRDPSKCHYKLSLFNVLFTLNPFNFRLSNYGRLNNYMLLISFVAMCFYISIFYRGIKKQVKNIPLVILLLLSSFVFLILSIYSYLTTALDILGVRLLLVYYLFLYFAVIVIVDNTKNRSNLTYNAFLFVAVISFIVRFSDKVPIICKIIGL